MPLLYIRNLKTQLYFRSLSVRKYNQSFKNSVVLGSLAIRPVLFFLYECLKMNIIKSSKSMYQATIYHVKVHVLFNIFGQIGLPSNKPQSSYCDHNVTIS